MWIPRSFFKALDNIISSFIWSPQVPRISIRILQEPWGQGGLALPDWHKYYVAGQMVVARLMADDGDSATVLETAHLGSFESLKFALYRGPKSCLPLTSSMKATIRVWETTTILMSPSYLGVTPSAPLWMNPALHHFYSLPDPMVWVCGGVKVLGDITIEGELCIFDQLKATLPYITEFFLFPVFTAAPCVSGAVWGKTNRITAISTGGSSDRRGVTQTIIYSLQISLYKDTTRDIKMQGTVGERNYQYTGGGLGQYVGSSFSILGICKGPYNTF